MLADKHVCLIRGWQRGCACLIGAFKVNRRCSGGDSSRRQSYQRESSERVYGRSEVKDDKSFALCAFRAALSEWRVVRELIDYLAAQVGNVLADGFGTELV